MAKYIDVESLVVAYSGHTPDDEFSKGVGFVLGLLDSKPPADVRPVRRGRWKRTRLEWYCTNCELYPPFPLDYDPEEKGVPYCQWCGADMRGGDAE